MMNIQKRIFLPFLISFFPIILFGQSNDADFMRSIGKIYVVVAVIVAIFLGLILFLIYLDRRLTKLEHKLNHNE